MAPEEQSRPDHENRSHEKKGMDVGDALNREDVVVPHHTTPQGSTMPDVPTGHMTDHKAYKDVNFRAVIQFVIGLMIMVVISYVAMYGMFKIFESQAERTAAAPSPFADTLFTPIGPDIQVAPHVDMIDYRVKTDSLLRGGGNVLSIDKAMDAIVAEGLPFRASPAGTEESEPIVADTAVASESDATPAQGDTTRAAANAQ